MVSDVMRRITEALEAGQAEAALEACLALLRETPQDAPVNELAARAALQAARSADAKTLASRSLAVRPDHAPTLALLGRAAKALGEDKEAIEAFHHAVRIAPEQAEAAFALCATLLKVADPQAREMLNHLLARFPKFAAGWDELGEALLAAGKPEAALICASRAAQAEPSFARLMRLGVIEKERGRFKEASVAFRRAVAVDDRSARAWFLLGTCCQDARDLAAAASAYRTALAIDPGLAEAAVNLGTTLQDSGDLDGAKRAYGRAVTIRPDTFGRVAQAMTTSSRGELWLDLGQLRRSLAG